MMKRSMFTACLLLAMSFSMQLFAQEMLLEKKFSDTYLKKGIPLADGYAILGEKYYDKVIDGQNYRTYQPFLARLDANLETVWQKNFPKERLVGFEDMVVAKDGYYLIGHRYGRPVKDRSEAWLVKLDLNGNQLWERFYAYPAFNSTEGSWLKLLPDGDLMMMCRAFRNSNSVGHQWLHRMDPQGNSRWEYSFREVMLGALATPMLTEHNTLIMIGGANLTKADFDRSSSQAWMVEIDLDHPTTLLRSKFFPRGLSFGFRDAMALADGHFWLVGSHCKGDKKPYQSEVALVELDADWNMRRYKSLDDGFLNTIHEMAWSPAEQRIYLFGSGRKERMSAPRKAKHISLKDDWTDVRNDYGMETSFRNVEIFDEGDMLWVMSDVVQIVR